MYDNIHLNVNFYLQISEEAIRPGNFKSEKYGTISGSGRSNGGGSQLDPEDEISRNKEFYRTQDVRPPFTYAALIRQVNLLFYEFQFLYHRIVY